MKALLKAFLCGLILALLLAAPGCGRSGDSGTIDNGPDENGNNDPGGNDDPADETPPDSLVEYNNQSGQGTFYRPDELSGPEKQWVENAAEHLPIGQAALFGDYLYILVAYGPKPTGGYAVEITDVLVQASEVVVNVAFTAPGAGDAVTQAITYPYDMVIIPAVNLPVSFNASGAESYVMELYGTDRLDTIVAASPGIKLFEPADGARFKGSLRFCGVASVFEGQVDYRLLDAAGNVITEGYTMAGMGDWHYFTETIDLAPLISGQVEATLELYTTSPKDSSVEDLVTVAVSLEP